LKTIIPAGYRQRQRPFPVHTNALFVSKHVFRFLQLTGKLNFTSGGNADAIELQMPASVDCSAGEPDGWFIVPVNPNGCKFQEDSLSDETSTNDGDAVSVMMGGHSELPIPIAGNFLRNCQRNTQQLVYSLIFSQ
jgi:hypothetical protein